MSCSKSCIHNWSYWWRVFPDSFTGTDKSKQTREIYQKMQKENCSSQADKTEKRSI